jgi:DNA mismatch endonuclease, patch repair protein
MADVHDRATRSRNMSRIRATDTKPEIIVRKYLHRKGLRYGLHNRKLPGKPDLVLRKYNTVIFVNGCFWHGHRNCRYFVLPKTRTEWWQEKIEKNQSRDMDTCIRLSESGWKVLVVWECELKKGKKDTTLKILFTNIVDRTNR